MAEDDLKITLSLDDQASAQAKQAFDDVSNAAGQATSKVNASLEQMGFQLKSVGMEIGKASAALGFFGAAMVAPFALALNNASKESIGVSNEMARLTSVTDKFQSDLASAVLPVVHQFANEINGLVKGFETLPKAFTDSAAQAVMLTGEFLIGVAAIGFFTKEIIALTSNLMILAGKFLIVEGGVIALNIPLLATVAIVAAVATAMIKWKEAGEGIVSAFEVVFRLLLTGVALVKMAFIGMAEAVVDSLEGILSAIAKVPGPQQKMVKDAVAGIDEWRLSLQQLGTNEMAGVQNQITKLGGLLTTGQGQWSKTFDDIKVHAQNFFDASKKGNDDIVLESKKSQTELVSLSNQLRDLNIQNQNAAYLNEKSNLTQSISLAKLYQDEWMKAHENVNTLVVSVSKTLQSSLSTAISDIILNTKSASQAFLALGQAMVKSVVDWVAQKVVAMALTSALEKSAMVATVASATAAGAAITAAFAPAALVASIASFGGAAVAAAAGFATATTAEISAMAASKAGAIAGLSTGTDTVPSMLTPGEMIVPRSMADAIRAGDLTLGGPKGAQQGTGSTSGSGTAQSPIYIEINVDRPTVSKPSDIMALTEEISRQFFNEFQRIH